MSGFAGILHLDGSPVDAYLLQRLVEFQKFRGPDAQSSWLSGNIGLGHTLLKISPESTTERQPLTLDGQTWIVADCRVDGRKTLIAELESHGNQGTAAPDVELILRAYLVWGEQCVDHLIGDFAFAIWDAPRHRLFCARDQLGVKPFYFAHIGSLLIFSNTLNCVRQHPVVSGDLNDLAIADFLLFDMIREPGATSFRDIQRLRPAHILTSIGEVISTRRYWTLPVPEEIRHKNPHDAVDQFTELMDIAVADRLRTDRVGVLMSGGLDSTTVAAASKKILLRQANPNGLAAYTEVFETLIPHEERHFASLAAKELNFPVEFRTGDTLGLWRYMDRLQAGFPEPLHSPWSDWNIGQLHRIAETRRVVLTGYGADPLLTCLLSAFFRDLLRKKQFSPAFALVISYLAVQGRLSRLYLRERYRRWFHSNADQPRFPQWLNHELQEHLCLLERWRMMIPCVLSNSAVRPIAYDSMVHPLWPNIFERYDAGVTCSPVEVRHPFFDLRLVNFILQLPALPWCSDKQLLRESSRGVLPDAVRLRRKSPLSADPLVALLSRPESAWVDSFIPGPQLSHYVRREQIPPVYGEKQVWRAWINLRPLSLNFWLRSAEASGINFSGVVS